MVMKKLFPKRLFTFEIQMLLLVARYPKNETWLLIIQLIQHQNTFNFSQQNITCNLLRMIDLKTHLKDATLAKNNL